MGDYVGIILLGHRRLKNLVPGSCACVVSWVSERFASAHAGLAANLLDNWEGTLEGSKTA